MPRHHILCGGKAVLLTIRDVGDIPSDVDRRPVLRTRFRLADGVDHHGADLLGVSDTPVWLAELSGDVARFRLAEDGGVLDGMLRQAGASQEEIDAAMAATGLLGPYPIVVGQ